MKSNLPQPDFDLELWVRYIQASKGRRGGIDPDLITAALTRGEKAAGELAGNMTVKDILEAEGLRIKIREDDGRVGGVRFRSRFVEGGGVIEVWRWALQDMEARASELGLGPDRVLDIILAHELYHALQYRHGGGKGRGGVDEEIAASAFAGKLLGLEFNPVAFDLADKGLYHLNGSDKTVDQAADDRRPGG